MQPQGEAPVISFHVAGASGVFEIQDRFQGLERQRKWEVSAPKLIPFPGWQASLRGASLGGLHSGEPDSGEAEWK